MTLDEDGWFLIKDCDISSNSTAGTLPIYWTNPSYFDHTNVYMPTKNIIILVGDSLGLLGDMKDSVSLHPSVQFQNLPYITSDEYDREVPVDVMDRLPAVKNVEYWDDDGDGFISPGEVAARDMLLENRGIATVACSSSCRPVPMTSRCRKIPRALAGTCSRR